MRNGIYRMMAFASVFLLICFSFAETDATYGDVEAKFIKAYDGDTITVSIPSYPPIVGRNVGVRVFGIDTAEIKGTSGDVKEKARNAKRLTENLCKNAGTLELRNIRRDKYFRILAEVFVDGKSLADLLIKNGLAKPYDGGKKSEW